MKFHMRTAVVVVGTVCSLMLVGAGRAHAEGSPVDVGLDQIAQTLLAKVSNTDAPLVLMADFTNPNIDGGERLNWELGRYVSRALGRKLGQSKRVTIVDRAKYGKQAEMFSASHPQMEQVARESGAVYLVRGTVSDLGKTAGVKVSLHSAPNGKTITSADSVIDKIEAFSKMYEDSKAQTGVSAK